MEGGTTRRNDLQQEGVKEENFELSGHPVRPFPAKPNDIDNSGGWGTDLL